MNELFKNALTTLEVAEMMEIDHWKLLRKLEGRTKRNGEHIKGYIDFLTDNQLVVSDYFIPFTYKDVSGKENKCYKVTGIGCDFLANKSSGKKGVMFTARYIKRFYEMEQEIKEQKREEQAAEPVVTRVYELKSTSLGEIASYIKEIGRRMDKQGSQPYEICAVIKMVSEQFGVPLPTDFVKLPKNKIESIFDIVEENYYD